MVTFRSNIGDGDNDIGNLKFEEDRGILDPLNIS
jgi:hypothetical protein